MPKKTITFDNLPQIDEIELELDWSYRVTPGRFEGLPENCFPDDAEWEITPPADLRWAIMARYIRAAEEAITMIEGKISDMDCDAMPRKWAEEEGRK